MRKLLLLFCLTGLLAAVACGPKTDPPANGNQANTVHVGSAEPGAKTPPENEVTIAPVEVPLKPGGSADAKVALAIVDPYHVHANPASQKSLIATTLTVTPPAGITVDAPVYPPGQSMKFSFDEHPLLVYAKSAEIGLRVHADKKQPAGVVNLPAKLRYQACDDTTCYPPKTIDVNVAVNVKE